MPFIVKEIEKRHSKVKEQPKQLENHEVYTQVVAILDKFEVLDKLNFTDYIQVYSRHFIEKSDFTIENMVQKYYNGYLMFCEN